MFWEGDRSGAAVLCSPSRLGGMQGREISPPALDLVSRFRVYWERVAALKGTCLAPLAPGELGFGMPDLGIL